MIIHQLTNHHLTRALHSTIGQTISHYQIIEKLAEGGMGIVYKVQDTKLDRIVALKFLPAHVSVNAETKARFLQEAKAAEALKLLNEEERYRAKTGSAYNIARVYTGLGENGKALEWLNQDIRDHSSKSGFLLVDPIWDDIRTDQRFLCDRRRRAMRRMGSPSFSKISRCHCRPEPARMSRTTHVSPYYYGLIEIGMGHTNRAVDDFYKAYDERDGILMSCAVDPIVESLRDNSRFDPLMRRMSLR